MNGRRVLLSERETVILLGCVGVVLGGSARQDAEIKALYEKLIEQRSEARGGASIIFWINIGDKNG